MVNIMALMGSQWAQPHGHGHGGGMSQMGFAVALAGSMVVVTMFQQFLMVHFGGYLERCIRRLVSSMDPFVQIKFYQDAVDGGPKNYEAYGAIETYLSAKCSDDAPRLRANAIRDIKTPVLCVDNGEGVSDVFEGIKVSWHLSSEKDPNDSRRSGARKNKYYTLTFRKRDRKIVVGQYLKYVMEEGVATVARNRQLKLYSNSSGSGSGSVFGESKSRWSYIMDFDHPATFETLAMEEERKQDIIEDLTRFLNGREYYRRIGKPWKRGYLLHGPPGTGKSTMIAAIANLLSYDVYDLELTAVFNNSSLKKLLNRTPSNSILVIEDIDCSSNITGQREKKQQQQQQQQQGEEITVVERVTLSGLLNCVDGLFSANDGGRLIIFTTNHVENLDSALIRRGRMDKHIEMSYCGFEAFRILARNYLGIENHDLFPQIRGLLMETDIAPADVAENLIVKGEVEGSADVCLRSLIGVLEKKAEEDKLRLVKKEDDQRAEQKEPVGREAVKENGVWTGGNEHVNGGVASA